jgi:predicted nuclease of predicted toxin-antitoxin system
MKLLVDQNLARRVAVALRDAGHDAVHVAERGLASAEDAEIVALAAAEERVIVSEDTDFGALLAHSGIQTPSFVLLRGSEPMAPDDQAALLIANLPAVESDLVEGAVVVFARGRIRVRGYPSSGRSEPSIGTPCCRLVPSDSAQ